MSIGKKPQPVPFRQRMVELAKVGKKPGELTKEFGCHVTSILKWVCQDAEGDAPANLLTQAERQELEVKTVR